MSMIFPGMDPYLENSHLWPGVHNALIVYLRDQMQPLLRPRYIAAIEQRVYIESPEHQYIPDVSVRGTPPHGRGSRASAVAEVDEPILVETPGPEMHESYIEIIDRLSGHQVVAIIEVVSPSNKFPGPGRDSYLAKQHHVMASTTHLVEIDLLRVGEHVMAVSQWLARSRRPYNYLACVNRYQVPRGEFELYPCGLRERLPRIGVPLAGDDPDVPLDIQAGIARVYEAGEYGAVLNYRKPCEPPLSPEDQAWADELTTAVAAGQ
jgi:hypothetical protein